MQFVGFAPSPKPEPGRLLLRPELPDEEYRGAFNQISIPRSLILATERHGEIAFKFSEQKQGCRVIVNLRKALLESEIEDWQASAEKIERALSEVFGG